MGNAKRIGADECRLAGLGDSLPDLTGRQKGKRRKAAGWEKLLFPPFRKGAGE